MKCETDSSTELEVGVRIYTSGTANDGSLYPVTESKIVALRNSSMLLSVILGFEVNEKSNM